jgi:TorA maturation chaperone TorD
LSWRTISEEMASLFKKWEPEGEDAAEIFRLHEAGTLTANWEEAWKEYSKLKDHWIAKVYKRKNLGANFCKMFKHFFEYKATLQGPPCIGSLLSCRTLA